MRRLRLTLRLTLLLALALGASTLPGPEAWAGVVSRAGQLYSQHRLASALEMYRRAEQLPRAANSVRLRQGQILLERGQPEEAAETFRQLVDGGHTSREAMMGLAEALHSAGDTSAALDALRRELEVRPEDGEAWTLLVERAARAGERPDQIQARVAGIPRPEGDTALGQRADYLAAACLLGPGSAEGVAALRRALAGPDLEVRALAADLLRSVEGGGGEGAAANATGVLMAHGLVGPALAAAEEALGDPARRPEALAVRGYGLLRIGRLDEAEASAREALELAPELRLGEFVLGSILLARGDEEGAMEYLVRAAKREPPNPAIYAELANSLVALGDVGGAEQTIRRAVDASPDDPDLRLAISRFHVDSQYRPSAVIEDAREAVRLTGRSSEALSTLGWALHLSGETQEALETLLEAVEKDPRSAVIRYRLGSVYEALERFAESREQYELAVELDGAGEVAKRARAALSELDERAAAPEGEALPGAE